MLGVPGGAPLHRPPGLFGGSRGLAGSPGMPRTDPADRVGRRVRLRRACVFVAAATDDAVKGLRDPSAPRRRIPTPTASGLPVRSAPRAAHPSRPPPGDESCASRATPAMRTIIHRHRIAAWPPSASTRGAYEVFEPRLPNAASSPPCASAAARSTPARWAAPDTRRVKRGALRTSAVMPREALAAIADRPDVEFAAVAGAPLDHIPSAVGTAPPR